MNNFQTNKITTSTSSSTGSCRVSSAGNGPLPVLEIFNDLIVVASYLSAIQNATLPGVVVSSNATLATEYVDWQESIWEAFYEGLLNSTLLAEAEEINNLIKMGITTQADFQEVITDQNNPSVPTVISRCDDIVSQISSGTNYMSQINLIAEQIKSVDKIAIQQLDNIINTLNSQFSDLEQKLTEKAINNGKEIVVTIVNVGVAVASEKDPVSPLVEGVAQIGFDVINELVLSDEINTTLSELETAWTQLDQDTIQYAHIKLILKRLNAVTEETSLAINALNDIVNGWQTICNVINSDNSEQWNSTGMSQVTEWAARMTRVGFYGQVSQRVSG